MLQYFHRLQFFLYLSSLYNDVYCKLHTPSLFRVS